MKQQWLQLLLVQDITSWPPKAKEQQATAIPPTPTTTTVIRCCQYSYGKNINHLSGYFWTLTGRKT
jgi:hypothetical protein